MTNREQFIGNMRDTYYSVETSYPLYSISMDRDEVLETLAAEFGGEFLGSGAGFGERDAEFTFPTLIQALAFVELATRHAWLTVLSVQWVDSKTADQAYDNEEAEELGAYININWRHLLRI